MHLSHLCGGQKRKLGLQQVHWEGISVNDKDKGMRKLRHRRKLLGQSRMDSLLRIPSVVLEQQLPTP